MLHTATLSSILMIDQLLYAVIIIHLDDPQHLQQLRDQIVHIDHLKRV